MVVLTVSKSPSEQLALTNCLILNPTDARNLGTNYAIIRGKYIINIRYPFHTYANLIILYRPDIGVSAGQAGFNGTQRQWLQLALNDQIDVDRFAPEDYGPESGLEYILLEVSLLGKSQGALSFDTNRMDEVLHRNFDQHIFTLGQPFVMDFGGHNLLMRVKNIVKLNLSAVKKPIVRDTNGPDKWGIFFPATAVKFIKAPDSLIKLVGNQEVPTNACIRPDFNFEDLGIGGLEKEFWTIFRRAFASRIFPPDIFAKFGVRHVRGLMLYGPPGTGKTLIARQIAKMLNAREPKIHYEWLPQGENVLIKVAM